MCFVFDKIVFICYFSGVYVCSLLYLKNVSSFVVVFLGVYFWFTCFVFEKFMFICYFSGVYFCLLFSWGSFCLLACFFAVCILIKKSFYLFTCFVNSVANVMK